MSSSSLYAIVWPPYAPPHVQAVTFFSHVAATFSNGRAVLGSLVSSEGVEVALDDVFYSRHQAEAELVLQLLGGQTAVRVYHNSSGYVAARSQYDAAAIYLNRIGESCPSACWMLCDPDAVVSCWAYRIQGKSGRLTKTCREWASHGARFLGFDH